MDQKAPPQPTQPAPATQVAPAGSPRGADATDRSDTPRDTDRHRTAFRDWASI